MSPETPLSPQQRHIWRLQTDSRAYRSQCTVLLCGDLDAEALRRAVGEAVARHEALRTTFRRSPGVRLPTPLLAAEPPAPLWQVADLSQRPEQERAAALDDLERQADRRPFDLERGPLVHAVLGRLADGLHALVLGAPALCADGASLDVLAREVAVGYAGEHPAGEPLQYGAAAHWLNETLAAEESRAGRDHWRAQGRPERFALRLPFETRAGAGFAPDRVAVPLEPDSASRAKAFAAGCWAELGDLLLAAWQVLLWRLDGEAPGAGVRFDGRPYEELWEAVGPYARWLPFPSRVAPGLSFTSLVDALRAEREEGADWQVAYAAEERAAAGIHACFDLWERPAAITSRGVAFEPARRSAWGERFKVCLAVTRDAAGLAAELWFDSHLLAPEHARPQAERFARLLAALLEAPERQIAEAPAVSAEEVAQILAWQGAAVSYPVDACLHRLIEAKVERTPGAVALEFEGEELTYRQLDERANRLARRLRALGAGPEARVAVCLERSLELVVSLLAVLKAGAAYVPLDPGYPPERLAYMLEDSAAAVLVTDERLLAALLPTETAGEGRRPAVPTLRVDAEREAIERESAAPLPDAPPAEALAYAIYTSGSTGRPKGAMNSHRAIINRLLWMQDTYGLTAGDRVLQKTPASFDVSVWELFWPLLAGARLVVARPGGHQDPAYLIDVISRRGITTLHFVPSMLLAFLDSPGVEACTGSLRRVICSGEALTVNLADAFFQRLDDVELHNLYGPTEAAVDVTAWHCDRERSRHTVPIGHPVANTSILLLDADRRPVPPGSPGELYIGGAQVGRGYLGRPDLTAERFVPDPFGAASGGGRLYRTGDLARYEADGAVDFLGRVDHQVKVRGFRIELGEVETALTSHPDVREAAVLAREENPGERRLVAYYVPRERTPSVDDLRRFLGSRLPDFMVPALFVRLAALPLNPNGKLDRVALPAPGSQRPDLEHEYVAPGSPVEQALAEVWSEVLGIEAIGVHDSFFALGGDSIRSVRVAALAKERGIEMAVE
ncbi:MAG TPA: amino acid adenylation domain-containing protein, partial [Thermoanaerobaculia bacterium]|nr:amino acid adenylation domain-containing protein [Thermoanaerobaculia bacterium]